MSAFLPKLILTQNRPLRFITFFYLYVMQGIPAGFATTALANYLAAEGLRPDRIGTFVAMQGLPWTLQFVWGPFIDRFQGSPMGRRRPWVVGAQLVAFLASLSLFVITDPGNQVTLLGLVFLVHATVASVQDASVDAMAISTIPANERGRINAVMRGGFLVGMGLGAAGLSQLMHNHGFQSAVFVQSACLLVLTVVTFFIRERPTDAWLPFRVAPVSGPMAPHQPTHSTGWLFRELIRGLTARQSLRLFLPIIVVYMAQSIFIRAYNTHLIQQLGWSDTDLSGLSGSYGVLLVVLIIGTGGFLADRFGAQRLLPYLIGIHAVYLLSISLLAPWWNNPAVAASGALIWNMMDPSLSVAAIPILMALCRTDVEGSQFTTYMALVNLADVAGSFLSGHAQRFVPASTLGLCSGLMVVCSWLWVNYTRRQSAKTLSNS